MKLITEQPNFQEVEILTEAIEGNPSNKNYYIRGIYMQAEITNQNGRRYPMEILENEVNRYSNSHVKENRAWGELNHPDGPVINLERVSHRIVSLKKEGNNFIGKALLVTTNKPGEIAKNLIESGGKLGVSSRALGSLRNIDGVNFIQEDLHIITPADIVADPSAPSAFVNGIMEGKSWVLDNGLIVEETVMQLKKQVSETFNPNMKSDEKWQKRCDAFQKFMKQISK